MKQKKIATTLVYAVLFSCYGQVAGTSLDLADYPLLNPTPGFGKTHFIVGYPKKEYSALLAAQSHVPIYTTSDIHVYFSPDDNLEEEFNKLVRQEQTSIQVAVYVFTNKDIAQALIDAKNRGVGVQIVTDPGHMKDRHSKIGLLLRAGIPVFEYNPDYIKDGRSNIMHHKFAIFGNPMDVDTRIWTGSFNFTKSATTRNQENAVIMRGREAVKRFADQYELLKTRCVRCYHSAEKNIAFAKNQTSCITKSVLRS